MFRFALPLAVVLLLIGVTATAGPPADQAVLETVEKSLGYIQSAGAEWIEQRSQVRDEQGRRQVVRNGYLPERKLITGLGEIQVRQPRVADRRAADEREPFSSKILPPYLRKTKSIEELIPWLYLKGVSTGDFHEALQAILGPDCPGLAATTITRPSSRRPSSLVAWNRTASGSPRTTARRSSETMTGAGPGTTVKVATSA